MYRAGVGSGVWHLDVEVVMTAHYARLHDTTVRRHWEKACKVNAKGETVIIGPQFQVRIGP